MSIRNYFRPSNGLSKPTGCISIALKSREQATSSPPCARSAEYFLRPITVHSTVATSPSQKQRTHPRYLSRQMSYDSSSFTAIAYRLEAFRPPTTLPLPPPILLYICGSLEYISFWKTFLWQLHVLSLYIFPPALATPLQTLCCKIFVLKYFRRTSTLRKIFNMKIFPTKILLTVQHFNKSRRWSHNTLYPSICI